MPQGLSLIRKTSNSASQDDLDQAAGKLFAMFIEREKEFGFNPAITVNYPDLAEGDFLTDPVGHINRLVTALAKDGEPIDRIVLLTTFGARLASPLAAAGYASEAIDWPAGPDETTWFQHQTAADGAVRTLYLEAVDEADPKIRPNFALELNDADGKLRGGACGSIHERDGARYAYLATMTLDTGLPAGTGQWLGEALIEFMRDEGVKVIHLGTQTAGPFYRDKLGFRITHTVLPALRIRNDPKAGEVTTDLVMMERLI